MAAALQPKGIARCLQCLHVPTATKICTILERGLVAPALQTRIPLLAQPLSTTAPVQTAGSRCGMALGHGTAVGVWQGAIVPMTSLWCVLSIHTVQQPQAHSPPVQLTRMPCLTPRPASAAMDITWVTECVSCVGMVHILRRGRWDLVRGALGTAIPQMLGPRMQPCVSARLDIQALFRQRCLAGWI